MYPYSFNFFNRHSLGSAGSSFTWSDTPTLPTRASSSFYQAGQKVIDPNGRLQVATIGGVSSGPASPPTWATVVGAVTIDNTVTWTCGGSSPKVISVGDMIYVAVSVNDNHSVLGVTDSLGNSWVALGGAVWNAQAGSGQTNHLATFCTISKSTGILASGGTYTVTSSFSGTSGQATASVIIFSGPGGVGSSNTISASGVVFSPYLGNGSRAGPIGPGTITNSGPVISIFTSNTDYTVDPITLPSGYINLWGDSFAMWYAAGAVGTSNPFILSLTPGAPDPVGWAATVSQFTQPPAPARGSVFWM